MRSPAGFADGTSFHQLRYNRAECQCFCSFSLWALQGLRPAQTQAPAQSRASQFPWFTFALAAVLGHSELTHWIGLPTVLRKSLYFWGYKVYQIKCFPTNSILSYPTSCKAINRHMVSKTDQCILAAMSLLTIFPSVFSKYSLQFFRIAKLLITVTIYK